MIFLAGMLCGFIAAIVILTLFLWAVDKEFAAEFKRRDENGYLKRVQL